MPNPYVPTFAISVPASKPRGFCVGDGPPKLLHRKRPSMTTKRSKGLVGRWSGVEVTTEYPASQSSKVMRGPAGQIAESNSPLVSEHRKKPGRIRPSSQSYHHAASVEDESESGSAKRDDGRGLWQLSGPVECMLNLPMGATKQNAMLVHTCKLTCSPTS